MLLVLGVSGGKVKYSTPFIRQVYVNSKAAICVSLSLLTALAPSMSYALDVQVQRTVNLRTSDSPVLQKVGRLAAGSIVSIPDQFAVKKDGKVDFESTLNNWLSKSSTLANEAGLKNFSDTKKDFYFPIKIVKAAPGSQLGNQDSYMVALHYLHRKGALLETTADTDLNSLVAVPAISATEAVEAPVIESAGVADTVSIAPLTTVALNNTSIDDFEASAVSVCTECQASQTQSLHPLAGRLQAALDSHLRKPLEKMTDRTVNHTQAAASKFEKTCHMRIEDFVSSLRNEISNSTLRTTVPTALTSTMMLGLMTQETTGNCKSTGDHGTSVGLFQVNANSSRYTHDQLRNPVTNARAALDNLESKHQALSRDFDFSKMSEDDRLRLLVSAYNGGERWVRRAKDDLLQFNRQQGASMNPNSWEDLRIFYFRRHMGAGNEYQAFGTVRGGDQRSTKNALNNLAYTENLIPRTANNQGVTLQEAWHRRING
jgi:hypothetical protein